MREIELKPSRRLGLLLSGMALLALVAIYVAALPGETQAVLGVVVLGLSGWSWRRTLRTARLRIVAGGRLQSRDDTGEWDDVEIQGDSFASIALIVLRYRVAGQPVRTLPLLPDSAAADDLRRLRASLRWTRRTRSDTASPDAG